jgi:hypothetical protein
VHQDGPFKRGDSDDMMIEDFPGFADNLMLISAAVKSVERIIGEKTDPTMVVQHNFVDAADLASTLWKKQRDRTRGIV